MAVVVVAVVHCPVHCPNGHTQRERIEKWKVVEVVAGHANCTSTLWISLINLIAFVPPPPKAIEQTVVALHPAKSNFPLFLSLFLLHHLFRPLLLPPKSNVLYVQLGN